MRATRLEFGEHRHPDRAVDRLLQQVDEVVGEPQPQVDLGMQGPECGQERRQHLAAEAQRGGDPQAASRRAAGIGDRALRPLERAEHVLAGLVIDQPLLGRLDLARGPVEQAGAEMALELLQAMAHDRRRQAEMAAGRRQAAELDHPDEHPDVLEQRHGSCLLRPPRLFGLV